MHDIAEFLRGREPFSELEEGELERLAARAEVEFFAAGMPIARVNQGPETVVRLVRRGAVELVADDRPIDLVEEGELLDRPSSGPGEGEIQAQAAEDTLTYALPASEVGPLLGAGPRPDLAMGEKAVTASTLVRAPALFLEPDTSLRQAARAMDEQGAGVALIDQGGTLGILTDRDLRSRVLAGGLSGEEPVTEAMTTPVISTTPEEAASDVIRTMLEHDVHHIPVLSGRSDVIGIIESADLLAADRREPFVVRRAIALARDRAALQEAAAALQPTVVGMHRAGMTATQISEAISVVTDALVRRAIDLSAADLGAPPADFAWLALGSHGRREPVPSSDLDSGMVWRAASDAQDESVDGYMQSIGEGVEACMREIGWRLDPHGVTASGGFSASSVAEWEAAISDWLARPTDEGVALAISITMDARVVHGPDQFDPRALLWESDNRSRLLRVFLSSAIAASPPTGFLRDIVVERSGEHRGTLDIKRGALGPVVDLARFVALEAGTRAESTIARLRGAAAAGVLGGDDANALERAFELFSDLRIAHQAGQLEAGSQPDDHLDPKTLDPLTRRYLRDAFREVAAIQESFARKLDLERGRI